MKRFLPFVLLALLAAPAAAQPWFARGEFNAWGQTAMTVDPQNAQHLTTALNLFENADGYKYKIACCGVDGWQTNMPSSDGRFHPDAAGNITLHLWDTTTWTDGYLPNNTRRVGYSYDGAAPFGWEIFGSFNGWPGTSFDPNYALTDMGNGLYSGQFQFNAGFYDFKYRALVPQTPTVPQGGYSNTTIGGDFGNSAGNNSFAVAANGDMWQFDLDLPKGRFRYFAVDQHGDFNGDGTTDAADYVYWRKNNGTNMAKYNEWRANFGRTTNLSWVVHGTFGPDVTLTNPVAGVYSSTLTGLTAGQAYDVQVFRSDASSHWPGTPAKITADASGNINLKFRELQGASWNDGYQPDTWNRLGYADSNQFDWEIIGPFNGTDWNAPATLALTDQGNGLHTGSFAMTAAGATEFKFRKQGDWGTSIGPDFGNGAGNNAFTVDQIGDIWNFELDLPNGRWKAYHPIVVGSGGAVPEPASVALAMFGLALMGLVRRR